MRKTDESVIEITEDIELKGTGYILEKGDRIQVIDEESDTFKYQMLSRLQSDCEYAIKTDHSLHNLWGKTVAAHIAYMRKLYNELSVKPEWITPADIDSYEKELLKYGK